MEEGQRKGGLTIGWIGPLSNFSLDSLVEDVLG